MDVVAKSVRFSVLRDLDSIYEIDRASHLTYMRDGQIEKTLKNKNALSSVVESDEHGIVGYLIYYVKKERFIIERMAVAEGCRRQGCGTMLVEKLMKKLGPFKRSVEVLLRESNLEAQLFFNKLGFSTVQSFKNYYTTYHDSLPYVPYTEDALLFRYEK